MSKKEKQLVFVALSGGVDSAVAAGLLKKKGYQVVGVFMKCWTSSNKQIGTDIQTLRLRSGQADLHRSDKEALRAYSGQSDSSPIGCGWEQDEEDARQVAAKLAIPFLSWDFTREYKQRVIDYFLEGYQKGITPNPDIMCNREIKFGLFLKRAIKMGADKIATGHYVRIRERDIRDRGDKRENEGELGKIEEKKINPSLSFIIPNNLSYFLLKGVDPNKDQSYFLWTLTQEQLKYCLFPIGDYEKPEVREFARKWDLPVKDKPDSQGICFMGKVDVKEFLKAHLKMKSGKIRTTEGAIIGEHTGLEYYTIGQRRGIEIGGGIPYFVAAKDFKKNELIVAKGSRAEALFEKELWAGDVHWISGKAPKMPFLCQAKIRYRQPDQKCEIKRDNKGKSGIMRENEEKIKVEFYETQRAITAGQSVVFYDKEIMLGGGIIES